MYCYTLTPRQGLDLSSESHDIHLPVCDVCALNHLLLVDKPEACLGNIHSFLSLRFRLDIKKLPSLFLLFVDKALLSLFL